MTIDPKMTSMARLHVTRVTKPNEPEFRSAMCKAALHKELSRLRDARVWDEENLESWPDARHRAMKDGMPR